MRISQPRSQHAFQIFRAREQIAVFQNDKNKWIANDVLEARRAGGHGAVFAADYEIAEAGQGMLSPMTSAS